METWYEGGINHLFKRKGGGKRERERERERVKKGNKTEKQERNKKNIGASVAQVRISSHLVRKR